MEVVEENFANWICILDNFVQNSYDSAWKIWSLNNKFGEYKDFSNITLVEVFYALKVQWLRKPMRHEEFTEVAFLIKVQINNNWKEKNHNEVEQSGLWQWWSIRVIFKVGEEDEEQQSKLKKYLKRLIFSR